jgi:hypothetical protein
MEATDYMLPAWNGRCNWPAVLRLEAPMGGVVGPSDGAPMLIPRHGIVHSLPYPPEACTCDPTWACSGGGDPCRRYASR